MVMRKSWLYGIWEFDAEKEQFHQFQTIDYEVGMKYYEENKFAMSKEN